jgi:exosortase/archaeosortase family protein
MIAVLAVISFLNGLIPRTLGSISEEGFLASLLNTFEISVVVWLSLAIGVRLVWTAEPTELRQRDYWIFSAALALVLIPLAELSWVALAGVAAYGISVSGRTSAFRRGAIILLAVSVPMFWSRMVFKTFAEYVLTFDAALVGFVTGQGNDGNTVAFSDQSGYIWIAQSCSSLSNVSLAILCWVTVMQLYERRFAWRDLLWCLAACLSVVVINVIRLSLIVLFPDQFELIHGTIGNTVAAWLILIATVAICLRGVGRAQAAHS